MDKRYAAFLAVAEVGSITAASEMLNITQPTLTKRLQLLEQDLGSTLFNRSSRGLTLRAEGEMLLPYAIQMRNAFLQGREAVLSVQSGYLEELRIGAGPLFHLRFVEAVLPQLMEEFPNTRLSVRADFNSRLLPDVRDRFLDVAFGSKDVPERTRGLSFRQLTMVERGVIICESHALAKLEHIAAHDLKECKWIAFNDTSEKEEVITGYFKANGLGTPNIILQTTSLSMAFKLVKETAGAMALPIQLQPVLNEFGLVSRGLDPLMGRIPAGAYFRPSSAPYPIVRRAVQLVQEQIQSSNLISE